jgi:hypothetical protein
VGDVVAGAIEDDRGMCAGTNLPTDLGEMQRHGLAIGDGQDEGGAGATLRTNGAEDVGPLVALIVRRARAGSPLGPDAGQCALLAYPRFVLEPDFDGLVPRTLRELRGERRGEVFLNAS